MKRILITGGPSSGVTTLGARLVQSLTDSGFFVHTEDPGEEKSDQDVFLDVREQDVENLEITKYDLVIDMESAANQASEWYVSTLDPAIAIEKDRLRRDFLLGHHALKLIPSQTDFMTKIAEGERAVRDWLEVPSNFERKFLLDEAPSWSWLRSQGARAIQIEQYYLTAKAGFERRLRRRFDDQVETWFLTEKGARAGLERLERERVIDKKEAENLMQEWALTPHLGMVRKTRYHFVFAGQHYELDHFARPPGIYMLEIELANPEQDVRLPAELPIKQEVTGDQAWLNSELARSQKRELQEGEEIWVMVRDPVSGPSARRGKIAKIYAQGNILAEFGDEAMKFPQEEVPHDVGGRIYKWKRLG